MADQIIQCQASLIKVENRFRKDFGDIESLAKSISELGLLQPIGIDSGYRLVFGERRLRACLSLGWQKIPVRTVHIESILKGELAENEFRKDFTPSERVAIGEAIERELGNRLGANQHSEGPENFPDPKGDTRDLAAKAAGFGNGKTYEQAKRVTNDAAPELVQAMDEGRASVSAAASLLTLPKDQQAVVACGDKKSIQKASKDARSSLKQTPAATDLVLTVVTQIELLARYLERNEVDSSRLHDLLLADLCACDSSVISRLSATTSLMAALGRIAESSLVKEAA
ncbi:Chromosome-partitioning protein Spo0J [compost metagenome]